MNRGVVTGSEQPFRITGIFWVGLKISSRFRVVSGIVFRICFGGYYYEALLGFIEGREFVLYI